MWNENPNLVFSPLSLHTALAILTSGSTVNSTTEQELINALGRSRNVQGLEQRYQRLLDSYDEEEIKPHLSYGNLVASNPEYFNDIKGSFFEQLDSTYNTEFEVIRNDNSVRKINNYVRNVTQGKIDKIIGTETT